MSQLDFYTTGAEASEFISAYEKVRDTVSGQHSLSAYSSADHTNFTVCIAATGARVLMELSAAMYTELPSRVIELEEEEPYTENHASNFTSEAPEPFSPIGTGVGEDEDESDEEEEPLPGIPTKGSRPKLIRQNGDKLPSSISVE